MNAQYYEICITYILVVDYIIILCKFWFYKIVLTLGNQHELIQSK